MMQFRAFVIAALVLAVTMGAAAQSTEPTAKTVWDGVYSEDQAARGQHQYTTHCANCHREDLSGYGGLLLGSRFMEKFREASLHLLFDKTRTTMPRGAAGSLSDEAYVDIVSYLLKMNEFPAGSEELQTAQLANVQVVSKTGPEPVPNFSLIRVVGCLTQSDRAWLLTNTTEPARSGNPQPSAEERSAAANMPLGSETFDLMVSAAYSPERAIGQKVEVRGFLIRRPTLSRINITSLETLQPTCGG